MKICLRIKLPALSAAILPYLTLLNLQKTKESFTFIASIIYNRH